ELALGDREADVIDCSDPSEALADALEGDRDGSFVRHPRRVCHLTEGYRLVRVSSSLADEGEDAAPPTRTDSARRARLRGRDADWYFESIADSSSTAGERGDTFISQAKAAGAQAMVTIPMLDWVAKLGPNRSKLASFSQAKYGAQTGNDWQWYPDAGNGVLQ